MHQGQYPDVRPFVAATFGATELVFHGERVPAVRTLDALRRQAVRLQRLALRPAARGFDYCSSWDRVRQGTEPFQK